MKAMIEAIRLSSLNQIRPHDAGDVRISDNAWVSVSTGGIRKSSISGEQYAEFQLRLDWCVDRKFPTGITFYEEDAILVYALCIESTYGTLDDTILDDASPDILERAVATAEELSRQLPFEITSSIVAKDVGRKSQPTVIMDGINYALRYARGAELREIPISGNAGSLYYGMAKHVGAIVTDKEPPSLDKESFAELATQLAELENSTSEKFLDSACAARRMDSLSSQAPQGAMSYVFQNGFMELTQIYGPPVKCVSTLPSGRLVFDFCAVSASKGDCAFACVDYEKTVHVFSYSSGFRLWGYTRWFKESWMDLIDRGIVSV